MAGRSVGCRRRLGRWAIGCLLVTVCAPAQVRARPLAYDGVDAAGDVVSVAAALRTMAEQAGVIFVGTVRSVRRVDGDGFSGVGVLEVTFQVEQAVRGVAGPSYVLREWGGLWPPGQAGFAVGDRRLMLLHSPGVTGLSSPVGGAQGAIPVVGAGMRVGRSSGVTASAQPVVDLRWIAATVAHRVSFAGGVAAVPSAEATALPTERAAALAEERTDIAAGFPGRAEGVAGREQTTPIVLRGTEHGNRPMPAPVMLPAGAKELPLTSVMALLQEWQGSGNGGR